MVSSAIWKNRRLGSGPSDKHGNKMPMKRRFSLNQAMRWCVVQEKKDLQPAEMLDFLKKAIFCEFFSLSSLTWGVLCYYNAHPFARVRPSKRGTLGARNGTKERSADE
jgi:hypothetical protein